MQSYEKYQHHDLSHSKKALYSIKISLLWQKVCLNIVYIPSCKDYQFFINAYYNLSD